MLWIFFFNCDFLFSQSLSLDNKTHLTIKGKGMDKTVLSFKGQTSGAEGDTAAALCLLATIANAEYVRAGFAGIRWDGNLDLCRTDLRGA